MAKNVKILMAVFSIMLGLSSAANATLIGDTVWMEQRFPDFNTLFGSRINFEVKADASDTIIGGDLNPSSWFPV